MIDQDPDREGKRFLAAAYRTTRAILQCKRLLPLGKSLQEALAHDGRVFTNIQSMDPTSALGALSDLREAVLPTDGSDLENLSVMHGFAALHLGYGPEDPCLHWFHKDLIGYFMPDVHQLVMFEDMLLRKVQKPLAQGGKHLALKRMEKILGPASPYERRDWAGLPMSRLRDLAASTTEDDRALMIARLERIAAQAEDALDVRAALSALRQVAAVQGLLFMDNDKQRRQLLELLSSSQQAPRSEELAYTPPPARPDDDDTSHP